MSLGSKVQTATTLTRQLFLKYRVSDPFLTGDLFARKSDLAIDPNVGTMKPSLMELKEADVLFCASDLFLDFLRTHHDQIKAKVIIVGNGDTNFYSRDFSVPKGVKKVFVQNLCFPSDDLFEVLPIGIENLRWGKNGLPGLFKESYSLAQKERKALVGPFSPTNSEREFIRDIKPNNYFDVLTGRVSPKALAAISSKYSHVASPQGNGMDTHRFWEALYRGSSPIVLKSEWASNIKKLGIPFSEIEKWDPLEIESAVRTESNKVVPAQIQELWWAHWKTKISDLIG